MKKHPIAYGIAYGPIGLLVFIESTYELILGFNYGGVQFAVLAVLSLMAFVGAAYIFLVFRQNSINGYTNWSLVFTYIQIVGGNLIILLPLPIGEGGFLDTYRTLSTVFTTFSIVTLIVGLVVNRLKPATSVL
ncbi:MAG: hypothetical protein B7X03_02695 [Parcubacteria group bacterium 21-58-10]|nr:MAG: hypothetical protein B7X03_02695 [Parcubacteria group bacterium 21-58-10]